MLGVVGDVDPDKIVDAIASHLADWPGSGPVALPARKTPVAPTSRHEVALEKKKNQAHVVYGFLSLTIEDPDLPALDVLTQILSGQGGRLFLELRDKQSLAYSVTAFDLEGIDPGIWGVYIAGEPAKLGEMKTGIERELHQIVDGPISDEELARAKAYLIGSQAVSLQRFGTQASLLSLDDLYGLGATYHLDYDDRIAAISVDDVKRVAKRVIRLNAPTIAIVK